MKNTSSDVRTLYQSPHWHIFWYLSKEIRKYGVNLQRDVYKGDVKFRFWISFGKGVLSFHFYPRPYLDKG